MGIGDWGLGIGDWGLGIGPNPQSPIPNPQFKYFIIFIAFVFQLFINNLIDYIKIKLKKETVLRWNQLIRIFI